MSRWIIGFLIGVFIASALPLFAQQPIAVLVMTPEAPCAAWLRQKAMASQPGFTTSETALTDGLRTGYITGFLSTIWAFNLVPRRKTAFGGTLDIVLTGLDAACAQRPEKRVIDVLLNLFGYR